MRLLIVATLLLGCALSGQERDRRSPREALDPLLYQRLSAAPLDQLVEQLMQVNRRTEQKLDAISAQHNYLLEQQRQIINEMGTVLEMRKEVYTDTERLNSVERRMSDSESRIQRTEDHSEVRNVAILETKVDAIGRLAVWLMGGVFSLVAGAITFLTKRRIAAFFRQRWGVRV